MNSGGAVGPGRRPRITAGSPSHGQQSATRESVAGVTTSKTTLSNERDKRRKEGRNEGERRRKENNNDRRKKKKKKKKEEKEDPDHADCIVDCFLFWPIDHFAFQRMIQTYIMPLVSKKPIY